MIDGQRAAEGVFSPRTIGVAAVIPELRNLAEDVTQPRPCRRILRVLLETNTRRMRHVTAIATAAGAVLIAQMLLAQTAMKPTAPGTPGEPAWQGIVRTSDGRTFVTDGGLAIDAALAKPAKLPERELAGKVLENYFSTAHTDEYGFNDLRASGPIYTTPKGIPVNATYIDYLRRVLSAGAVRFRMSGELQPVVIVASGKAVGVLMPVRK